MKKSTDESSKKASKKTYISPKLVKLDKGNLTDKQKSVVAELEKKLSQWKEEKAHKNAKEENST
jgi:hypothetical protein